MAAEAAAGERAVALVWLLSINGRSQPLTWKSSLTRFPTGLAANFVLLVWLISGRASVSEMETRSGYL